MSTQLALRLSAFNLHVARFAHPSWYAEELRGHLSARSEPQVSRWLLQELGLQDEMDWEMQEPQKRVWLLDAPSLKRLARELALAMHRDWLVRVIDGTRLRALQAEVGEQALRFVVEEVPENSFHYQSPMVSLEAHSPGEVGANLTEQGMRTLLALLQPAWRAVRGRAQLYFERATELGDVPPLEPVHRQRALELICRRLIPRRFPEWASYF
jgi:hypothetical protein